MTLQTNPAERREMVQAISERLGSPAVYLRTPTCAYRIGGLTVERDGSIISDDDALLEALRPMLIERGWLTAAAESDSEVADDQEGSEETAMESEAEVHATEKVPSMKDSEITQMELSFPVEDWTVPQLKNFLHTLYSNQYILRRMMLSDALYIERLLVERLKEAQTPADFEARLAEGLAVGTMKGCRLREGKLAFETAPDDRDPARRQACEALLDAVLRHAKAARRVFLKADADPENEKYHANSLLTRLGFAGREHRELRRTLMGHLGGYAAFKSEAGMQAHREKYAQLRRKQREEARP